MKRKIISMLCILVLLFSMSIPVHGEALSWVAATVDSNKLVTLSGRIDGGPGQTVNLLVLDPDGSPDYMNTCLSGAGGVFHISYALANTAVGRYTVTVGAAGVAKVAATSFIYGMNSLEAEAILEDGLVKVSGTVAAGIGQLITVQITAPDGTQEYTGTTMSIAGGGFQLIYTLTNTQTGTYTVYVGAAGIDTPAVCYFLAGMEAEVSAGIDEQNLVTVEGLSTFPGKPVSVRITDPKGETEYLSGVFAEKDGTFAVSYTMLNETNGRYTVSVSARGLDTPVTAEFIYGNRLTDLTLSSGALSPAFTGDSLAYSASVSYSTGTVTVRPYAENPLATIKVNNSTVKSGEASGGINLMVGENTVAVVVTAPNGKIRTYTIQITRDAPPMSDNAYLGNLTASAGTLSPAFTPGTMGYTISVASNVSGITLTPFAADAAAAVTVNGQPVSRGSASNQINLEIGNNTVLVKVTAKNGNVRTYTLTVIRAKSSNASLSGLTVTAGNLSPAFAPGTMIYAVSVANDVSTIQIGTAKADAGATVTVNGSGVSASGLSGTIGLQVGNNDIDVVVRAQDGVTVKTYRLTVTRAPSDNSNLSGINFIGYNAIGTALISQGISGFDPDVAAYTLDVPNNISAIRLTPSAEDNLASIKVNGANLPLGGFTGGLNTGSNTYTIVVTAQSGNTKTYTITIKRAYNLNLSNLLIYNGNIPMSPSFTQDTTSYTATVEYITTGITVTPVTVNPADAKIRVNNIEVASGSSSSVSLNPGVNTVTVTVTAPDDTVKTYTITVIRIGDNVADLSALTISEGSLTPQFSAGNTFYQVTVYGAETMTVTPTTAIPGAAVTVNGGSASTPVSLGDFGVTDILVRVTALNGTTAKTYTLKVTRLPAIDNTLSALAVSSGELAPAFSSTVAGYTVNVENGVGSITVIPTTNSSYATVKVNNIPVTSGSPSPSISLPEGESKVIPIVVTSQSGANKTYTVTVNRAPSSNANLSALSISPGSLSFNAAIDSYELSVDYDTEKLKVTPTVANAGAKVKVNGTLVSSGSASEDIDLDVGENTITVEVTAQDGTTIKPYTITVTRASSSNANLSSLLVGGQSIALVAGTEDYTVNVANGVSTIAVTPTADSTAKKIEVNGTAVANGGTTGNIGLSFGENEITVKVTAQDGETTKTYTITVIRTLSGNADLSSLLVGGQNVSLLAGTTSYTVNVANGVDTITVTPTAADSEAKIEVGGEEVGSGNSSGSINLNVGSNIITVKVTAQNDDTKTYTITVNRASSSNADLSSLLVGSQSVTLGAGTEYTVIVANEVDKVTVTPTADSTAKKIAVNGGVIANGGTTGSIGLNVGSNTITIVVTAQNDNTRTYTITVNRDMSSNADLSSLTVNGDEILEEETETYTINVANGVTGISLIPTVEESTASVIKVQHNTAVIAGAGSGGTYALTLNVGDNKTIIVVKAENGNEKTYTLTTIRASSDNANLASLSVMGWTLTPVFDPATENYEITVFSDTSSIMVDAIAADPYNATVKINGGSDAEIHLAETPADVTITVTAENGTPKTYTIKVNRSAEAEPTYSVRTDDNTPYGSITADQTTVKAGTIINLTITPAAGYRLKAGSLRYFGNTGSTDITGTSFTMPAANVTITAQFELNTYTITIDPAMTGGTIEADKATASPEDIITLTIMLSDEGWRLVAGSLKYKIGGTEYPIEGNTFIMPAADITITAKFEYF